MGEEEEKPREENKISEEKPEGQWVQGLEDKEEKEKYKRFLEYCEEKRREWRKQEEEDTARKEDAKRKEENWKLLRESISFLKKNESKWQHRKIKEVERIKNEEKADRLAIRRQKKKKYGIKLLNKEENKRIKERTEERIIISQAKANYWKMHRGEERGYKEMNGEHWRNMKEYWHWRRKGHGYARRTY